MAKHNTEDVVYALVKPIVEKNDLELIDVEYKKEGPNWYLRVYIDKENGVGLDDCQRVSEEISGILDEKDPINNSYFLEVSSPGLDRPLRKESDYSRYIDKKIEVTTYEQINNNKYFKGFNKGINDSVLTMILEDDSEVNIPIKSIASSRLYFEF